MNEEGHGHSNVDQIREGRAQQEKGTGRNPTSLRRIPCCSPNPSASSARRMLLLLCVLLLPRSAPAQSDHVASKCILGAEPRTCGVDQPRALITSTCNKNTDWNYHKVAKELRRWIRSIAVVSTSLCTVLVRTTYYIINDKSRATAKATTTTTKTYLMASVATVTTSGKGIFLPIFS